MNEHPSSDELQLYRAKTLDPTKLVNLTNHLKNCEACRATVLEGVDQLGVAKSISTQLIPAPHDRRIVVPSPGRLAGGVFAFACAVLLIYVGPYTMWKRVQGENARSLITITSQHNELLVAQSEIRNQRERISESETRYGNAQRTAEQLTRELLKYKHNLHNHPGAPSLNGIEVSMALPRDLGSLQTASKLRGSGAPLEDEVMITEPVGEYTELEPLFRWKAFPNATRYTIQLYVDGGPDTPVATGVITPPIEQAGSGHPDLYWEAPNALQPNRKYRWQVSAEFKNTEAKPVRSTPANFKTLSLNQAIRLAIVHANSGMVKLARRELEAVISNERQNRDAQKALAELRRKTIEVSPKN